MLDDGKGMIGEIVGSTREIRIALLGMGNIGRTLLDRLVVGDVGPYEVVLTVGRRADSDGAATARAAGVPFSTDPADLVSCDASLVVEAASQDAVRTWGERILRSGKSLVMLSAGALGDGAQRARLATAAEKAGVFVHVPSGAIGGVDAIKGAMSAGLDEVKLTTTKPPASLAGPAIDALGGSAAIRERTLVFSGSADDAAARMPQNLNVAVVLGLAGIGTKRTRVEVVAEPAGAVNRHRIDARGAFGALSIEVHNRPSPQNPKTSYLAILSTLAMLRGFHERIRVGT